MQPPPSPLSPAADHPPSPTAAAATLHRRRYHLRPPLTFKEKCDVMTDYIKRLRMCIKWFQELEGDLLFEQAKHWKMMDSAEKKCNDMEILMSEKEEELNSIIMALRKNYAALQEKLAKEESDKLAAMVSLTKEKDARLSVERSQAPILEELERAQRESSIANQKVLSLNDIYKRLQEYNTSLQQYNSMLQSELNQTNEILKNVEKEKVAILENLSNLRGYCTSLQDQLTATKASSNDTMKLNDALESEVGCLRFDLQQVRDERDRQLSQVQQLSAEVLKYKELTGKSAGELENLTTKSNELEATCASQSDQIKKLQEKLDAAENKLAMSDLSAYEIRTGYEEQKTVNSELQFRLAEAELKLIEGEALRKKPFV